MEKSRDCDIHDLPSDSGKLSVLPACLWAPLEDGRDDAGLSLPSAAQKNGWSQKPTEETSVTIPPEALNTQR